MINDKTYLFNFSGVKSQIFSSIGIYFHLALVFLPSVYITNLSWQNYIQNSNLFVIPSGPIILLHRYKIFVAAKLSHTTVALLVSAVAFFCGLLIYYIIMVICFCNKFIYFDNDQQYEMTACASSVNKNLVCVYITLNVCMCVTVLYLVFISLLL